MLRIIDRIKSCLVRKEILPENCLHPDSKKAYAHLLAYLRSIKNFLIYYYTFEMVNESVKQIKREHRPLPDVDRKLLLEHEVYFDIAVIAWCRLFGSPSSNQTHWKNIYNDKCLRIACKSIGVNSKAAFRNRILKNANMTSLGFKHLCKDMIDYRNKYVAHHDLTEALKTDDYDRAKMISLGITKRPDLKHAKLLILTMYGILFDISEFLATNAVVLPHYAPEEMMDDVCAELAGNNIHKKRWRK